MHEKVFTENQQNMNSFWGSQKIFDAQIVDTFFVTKIQYFKYFTANIEVVENRIHVFCRKIFSSILNG